MQIMEAHILDIRKRGQLGEKFWELTEEYKEFYPNLSEEKVFKICTGQLYGRVGGPIYNPHSKTWIKRNMKKVRASYGND